jgi:acetate kinase
MATLFTVNAGSSSIKLAVFERLGGGLKRSRFGVLDHLGTSEATMEVDGVSVGAQKDSAPATLVADWLERNALEGLEAVGHRVVNGLGRTVTERVTPELIASLRALRALDAEHLPLELSLMEVLLARHPTLPQFACFDSEFHRELPRVATLLPIPREFEGQGVRRYGFHGLSFASLMHQLHATGDAHGRVLLAHLGNGASLAAIRDGHVLDTSMGFTPNSGLMMGTRSGELDPGVVAWLGQSTGKGAAKVLDLLTHDSGMKGVSQTSGDVRALLALESTDVRAKEALELFCYQTRKWLGAFIAVLGGLDTLVFSGGIGENAPELRARICEQLSYVGVELRASANLANAPLISLGRVRVRVLHTDESLMLAQSVERALDARVTPW